MARTPTHPGKILGDELNKQFVAGKRNMTADTALRLSRYFGTSADFWMNLQTAYELDLARQHSANSKAERDARQVRIEHDV
jgi:antitoxin HigA-1